MAQRVKNKTLLEGRKTEVIKNAAILFVSKGYNDTTMDDIAATLNLSKASIYNYVDNKLDIVRLIYDHYDQLQREFFQRIEIETKNMSATEALNAVIEGEIAILDKWRRQAHFLNNLSFPLKPIYTKKMHAQVRYIQMCITNLLKKGINNKEFTDKLNPELTAMILLDTCAYWSRGHWYLKGISNRKEFITFVKNYTHELISNRDGQESIDK